MKNFIAIVLLIFFSCTKNNQKENFLSSKNDNVEDFNSFYERFHSDSIFQMNRITFPLDGFNSDSFTVDSNLNIIRPKNYKWSKKDWIMHRSIKIAPPFKEEFIREKKKVIHRVYIPNSEFEIERRFSLIKGKWYLTYYFEQNE